MSHTYKSKTAVYGTWLINKVTLLLCCLFTAAGHRASKAKLWAIMADDEGYL